MEDSGSEMFYEELPDSSEANEAKRKSRHSRNNTQKENMCFNQLLHAVHW